MLIGECKLNRRAVRLSENVMVEIEVIRPNHINWTMFRPDTRKPHQVLSGRKMKWRRGSSGYGYTRSSMVNGFVSPATLSAALAQLEEQLNPCPVNS